MNGSALAHEAEDESGKESNLGNDKPDTICQRYATPTNLAIRWLPNQTPPRCSLGSNPPDMPVREIVPQFQQVLRRNLHHTRFRL